MTHATEPDLGPLTWVKGEIDAALVASEITLDRQQEKLVEMSNGCICCTLREDLLISVRELAQAGRFDYLLIESSGISEPLPVAETFTFEDENGESLSQFARLDMGIPFLDEVPVGPQDQQIGATGKPLAAHLGFPQFAPAHPVLATDRQPGVEVVNRIHRKHLALLRVIDA